NLLDARALDLQFHRALWRAPRKPHLERTPYGLVIPLFSPKTPEKVTPHVRRWPLSHHPTPLGAITGRPGDDLQAVLLTHLRMSHTEPERYSAVARKPS